MVVVGVVGLLMATSWLCPVSECDLDLLVAELWRKGGMNSAWSDCLRLRTITGKDESRGDGDLQENRRGECGQKT